MAKQHQKPFRFCFLIFVSLCIFSSISFFIWWSHCSSTCCYSQSQVLSIHNENRSINLFEFPSAWNLLDFSSRPPEKLLKIALFVKKWPDKHHSGGLERHAMTLHLALATRGHEIHIFTANNNPLDNLALSFANNNLFFHLSGPTSAGYLDQQAIWKQFEKHNATGGRPFDVIHTESVALMHTRSRNHTNLAVSWHGIAYESIHSDIIQQLLLSRPPPEEDEQQRPLTRNFLTRTSMKVIEEVKNFQSYAHHVATSNHAGDVLKRIYMIPEKRVHIILNGVDENIFKPDPAKGRRFKSRFGIPQSKPKTLILGIAGRLVKDKGHPLMFEALKQIFKENSAFKEGVMILVAGNGPWRSRYKELGGGPNNGNVVIVGQLGQNDLGGFYNAIDAFVNPTLRAQGLDHTLLEAVVTGKAVMATNLASITETVIVDKETGYTFNPNVDSLKAALYEVWKDGGMILKKKGLLARERGLKLFTASKMAAAYEKLFLCLAQQQGEEEEEEEEETDDNCMYMYSS